MLVVDTDPGIDDSHAIAAAAKNVDEADLLVTTVAGNVGLDAVTDNAAWLLATLAPQAALHRGAALPLVGDHEHAAHIHGEDGLGGIPRTPERITVREEHAVAAIVSAYREHGEALRIVALGPLTNIALALSLEPGLAACPITSMGGSPAGFGNASINAEYNVFADPVAAEAVYSRARRLTLVTWDLTLDTRFTSAQIDAMFASGSPAARLIGGMEDHLRGQNPGYAGRETFARADGLAMAIALDPEACIEEAVEHPVQVGIGGIAHGLTSVDWQDQTTRPRVRLVQRAASEAVKNVLTL